MTLKEVVHLLEIEKECVIRQDGDKCSRNCDPTRGCYGCDLVQDGNEIVEAYNIAISMLNSAEFETAYRIGYDYGRHRAIADFKKELRAFIRGVQE